MDLLLEITTGPSAGKSIRLRPGQSVRIGRTERSEVSIPGDSHLSGIHFEIVVNHHDVQIRDLRSTNGTLLNGQKLNQAVLHNGDTIVAGESVFRAVITEDITDSVEPVPLFETELPPPQRLLGLLRNDFQPLYAILDSARDIKILALLMHTKEEYESLYEGVEGAKLAQVAPYLVRLKPDSALLEKLVAEGWGKSWGVYLICDLGFRELRHHLRHFLQVQLPSGEQVYFRYYDPRVLRVFLPTCTAAETNEFFGPIKYYLVEDEKPETLLRFVNGGAGADSKVVDLTHSLRPPDPPRPNARTVAKTTAFPQKAIPNPDAK